ncbi:gliding motility lipoprotein GldD [Arenibacter sp. GZD96]|uniref:gliding motility lipoprotein GldD n=1 Tax=Aurantibrevibacter litoralis TaxID=3106030 RepID=UPI002AFDD474|nr:gliding motility lipoprotein GldD [Arenibacter sp. GZD-96]MEA1787221.1 gliding motility lipoprotein GldD [Arenibacter sp. GZD-96]
MKNKYTTLFVVLFLFLQGCKENILPKPKAMLRLEYPEAETNSLQTAYFSFNYNTLAKVNKKGNTSLTLDYPSLKGSIFINYKVVDGNLNGLLSDAQKFSYEHVIKADNIVEQPFINPEQKVYGMYYEVKGDAASQSQFYVTDSTSHFVTGSLYFYAKPNYDSILPVAAYLQNDIRSIMETLQWTK